MATNVDIKTLLDGFNTTREIMLQDMFNKNDPGVYSTYTDARDAKGARTLAWAFIANLPTMVAWSGARIKKQPRGYSSSVSWAKYVSTLQLDADLLNYDVSGAMNDAVAKYLGSAVDFFDQVTHTAYNSNSGAGPTCYDGTALFNTSHPHGPTGATTQSNIGAGTTLTDANLKAAIIVGNGLREENGRNFQVNYSELHIGTKQKFVAEELFHATRGIVYGSNTAATTIENALAGAMKIVVDTRDTTFYWTLRDPKLPKPMLLLVGKAPEALSRNEPTDPLRWERNQVEFGIESDVGAAALAWQGVWRGTATA